MLSKEIIFRRLATIKYLYNLGIQQSIKVETLGGFSVLAFHDCAEMFLLLIAENKGDNCDKWSFMEYWNKYPELTLKESMRNLKDRRVNIKHKGYFPSKTDIEISRVTITDFLEQNTPIQFGIDFKDVSLSCLISNEIIKGYIDGSYKALDEGDLYGSLVKSKIAFMEILSINESNQRNQHQYNNVISIGEHIGNDYHYLIGTDYKSGARWFEQVTETINVVREILKITAIGIDYKKYIYFNVISPSVQLWYKGGEKGYAPLPKDVYERRNKLTENNCRFCIDFVIDSALKVQEFDYDINNYYS